MSTEPEQRYQIRFQSPARRPIDETNRTVHVLDIDRRAEIYHRPPA